MCVKKGIERGIEGGMEGGMEGTEGRWRVLVAWLFLALNRELETDRVSGGEWRRVEESGGEAEL